MLEIEMVEKKLKTKLYQMPDGTRIEATSQEEAFKIFEEIGDQ